MKIMYPIALCALIFLTHTNTMHNDIPQEITPLPFPQNISEIIIRYQLCDIRNHTDTIEQAHQYVRNVSLVNKACYEFANDIHTIRHMIGTHEGLLRDYSHNAIATCLKIPGAKKYLNINNQLFQNNLSVTQLEHLLQQGADPSYRTNEPNIEGLTALLFHIKSIESGHENIINMLISYASQKEWDYALNLVIQLKKYHLLKNFAQHGATFDNVFEKLIHNALTGTLDSLSTLELVLEHLNDNEACRNKERRTAIIFKKRADAVISLLYTNKLLPKDDTQYDDYENLPDLISVDVDLTEIENV